MSDLTRVIREVMTPPVFDDAEKTMTARMLYQMALGFAVVVAVLVLAMPLAAPESLSRWLLLAVLLEGLWVTQIVLIRRGLVRVAGVIATVGFWCVLTGMAWTAGGVSAPAVAAQLIIVVYAGMALGWRAGLVTGLLSTATVFALAWAEIAGLLPASAVAHSPMSRAISNVAYIAALAFLQAIIMRTLAGARKRVADELADRLAAEAEVRALNAELEERVAARTAELEAAVAQLEATNKRLDEATTAKSEFLASMSHELRTPLNSIIGFSGLLTQGMAGELSDEQRRQTRMISNSGRRLLDLVNQVLDLSRIEAGEERVVLSDFDAADVAHGVVEALAPTWHEKGLAVVVEAGEPATMHSDVVRFERILMNLVANAVRYTPVGGVTIRVSAEDGAVRVDVADTGPGIPATELRRVFDEFYQVDPPQGGKHEGTGLGLSIASRLASMLGGTIGVASEVGQGSTFTVLLPRDAPAEASE